MKNRITTKDRAASNQIRLAMRSAKPVKLDRRMATRCGGVDDDVVALQDDEAGADDGTPKAKAVAVVDLREMAPPYPHA